MKKNDDGNPDSLIMKEVLQGMKKIAYGEIVITIHDSRIVQIEHREKKRFPRTNCGDCTGRAQQEQQEG